MLLALTKLNSEGEWIKSLLDLPGQECAVSEGSGVVNITIAESGSLFDSSVGDKESARIDKENLHRLKGLGVQDADIKEPWCAIRVNRFRATSN